MITVQDVHAKIGRRQTAHGPESSAYDVLAIVEDLLSIVADHEQKIDQLINQLRRMNHQAHVHDDAKRAPVSAPPPASKEE
jgi:hypothetical protein